MRVAMVMAERGTCDRKQVGAVIAREGRIISTGYNGATTTVGHCSENMHGYKEIYEEQLAVALRDGMDQFDAESFSMQTVELQINNYGCRNATHAEANALAFAAKHGVSTDNAELFVTVAPCETCSRLLIAAGISDVVYLEAYRDMGGVRLLSNCGVEVAQVDLQKPTESSS